MAEKLNICNPKVKIQRWVDVWVNGWVGGGKSRFKDCLQQSKIFEFSQSMLK